jgi:hypothetical protein
MLLAGGVSAAMPAAQTAVVGAVAPAEIGVASGTYTAMRQLGGAFGIAVLSGAFSARGSFATPAAVTHGFTAAMAVAAALSAAGAVAGLWARRTVGAPRGVPAGAAEPEIPERV